MKIETIEYTNFKELEGKLNTFLVMLNGEQKSITIKELIDFIIDQKISHREKLHLAFSAMLTLNELNFINMCKNDLTSDNEIYFEVLKTFGSDAQIEMLVEELAELTKAVQKYKRSNKSPSSLENLCEEIADVDIVLSQIKLIMPSDKINHYKRLKLFRIQDQMKNKLI